MTSLWLSAHSTDNIAYIVIRDLYDNLKITQGRRLSAEFKKYHFKRYKIILGVRVTVYF